MTRMDAEQLAMTKSRNDPDNNYVAEREPDGQWGVVAYPVHRRKGKSDDGNV